MKPAHGVQKLRRRGSRLPIGTVVVDRSSRRGNPFAVEQILTDGDADNEPAARALAVRRYTNWLDGDGPRRLPVSASRTVDRDWINAHMDELIGHNLACTCPVDGLPCHRDVLLARASERAHYNERAHLIALVAAFAAQWDPKLDLDPAAPPPTATVLYLTSPQGQLSWHIAEADIELFDNVKRAELHQPQLWDGHTTEEKYRRIRELTRQLAEEQDAANVSQETNLRSQVMQETLLIDVRYTVPAEVHPVLVLAGQMLADRIANEQSGAERPPPRRVAVRVTDDWEALVTGLHAYWAEMRPDGGSVHSPAWEALQDIVHSGRAREMWIVTGSGYVTQTAPVWLPTIVPVTGELAAELGATAPAAASGTASSTPALSTQADAEATGVQW